MSAYDKALDQAMEASRERRRGLDGPPPTLRYFLTLEAVEAELEPPRRAYPGDAGFDLRILAPEPFTILPEERAMVPTGVGFEIPEGWYGRIFNRTSMGKQGLIPLAQVVDNNFTGALTLCMLNTDRRNAITLEPGERIAQIVFMPIWTGELERIERSEIKTTERGDGKYGSSGKF